MDDLQQLRIQRTPVKENAKCSGCVHYDGNAQSKGGACEVGQAPQLCGNGTERKFGYAPLAELGPDEIDDIATPTLVGGVGQMNETGSFEKTIAMQRVVLGEEDLALANRIHGELQKSLSESHRMGYTQGIGSHHCDGHLGSRFHQKPVTAYDVAKSLHSMHFAPRKQKKFGLGDVLDFMKSNGFAVADSDYAHDDVVKSAKKGAGSRGGNVIGHTRSGKAVYGPSQGHVKAYKEFHEAIKNEEASPRDVLDYISDSHEEAWEASTSHFTPEDDDDATALHEKASEDRKKSIEERSAHSELRHNHIMYKNYRSGDVEKSMTPNVRPLMKGGEGSRGGNIIGHTRSGKPVYGDKRPGDYTNFTPDDHKDASNMHSDAQNKASSAFMFDGAKENHGPTHAAHAKEHARMGAKKIKKSVPNVRKLI